MTTRADILKLVDEIGEALRLDRPAAGRAARAAAAAAAAERAFGHAMVPGPAGDRDAVAIRNAFWRLVSEVRRAASARTSHDGMIAAIAQAVEDARDELSELRDASRRNPAGSQ
ncbi:MAG: hypothetical protein ACO3EK_10270 [Alphaproteobacteria bacterium]